MEANEAKVRSPEEQARYYDGLYRTGYCPRASGSHKLVLNAAATFRGRQVKSILDIGCGRGLLVRELLARKFDVLGTEIAPVLFAKELRRLPAVVCPIQRLDTLGRDQFDVVMAIDVLDHLAGEEELTDAIEFMKNLAVKGVLIGVNEPYHTRTISKDTDWWQERLGPSFSEGYDCQVGQMPDSPAALFCYWKVRDA